MMEQPALPLPEIDVKEGFLSPDKPFAVVDIGSNSVRFVAYGGSARSPLPIFNEKNFCRLGESVVKTGDISGRYWDDAMQTFRRFKGVAKRLGVSQMIAVATAAVRQAENGKAFVMAAEEVLDTKVSILSGIEEGRFAALGVLMGFHKVDGLVADLGGGSLEFARVVKGQIKEITTLPIGVLTLDTQFKSNKKKLLDHVEQSLASIGWLKKAKGKPLYLVGGTWRALAEVEMNRRNSELRVLHHYKMPTKATAAFLDEFAVMKKTELKKLREVSMNRRMNLANAAIIMRGVLAHSGCTMSLVSSTGLREGIIYSALSKTMQQQDQLLFACREMAARMNKDPEYGEELIAWTEHLFAGESMSARKAESYERLRQAVCIISDVAWSQHLDFRGLMAAETVLHAPFTGISHAGRCFMANALLYRHNGSSKYPDTHAPRGFIPMRDKALKLSGALGLCLRLADSLSGSMSGLLMKTRLHQSEEWLILEVPKKHEKLVRGQVEKRLLKLAEHLRLKPEVKFT
ncbi:MAG: hypothetical protein ACON4J_02730 [Parvibaculales bacterium]